MNPNVPDSQHQRGTAATIQVTWTDEHGEAAAAVGAVTVRVQAADGNDVVVAGSATINAGGGVYTRALTAAQTATLNLLTATWTDAGSGATRTTLHELVSGFYFSVADARAFDTKIDTALATDARVRKIRSEVESECELITGVAWVPRFRRVSVSGAGDPSLVVPDNALRTIRTARTYAQPPTSYVAFTADQLAALALFDDGTITRTDGNSFEEGDQNLVFEYEHGRDRPSPELLHATLTRLRSRLYMEKTGVPDRARSFQAAEGGTYDLSMPGLYTTGIPDVDAVYQRYSIRRSRIAGRLVDYDPQRNSLFHGGRQ